MLSLMVYTESKNKSYLQHLPEIETKLLEEVKKSTRLNASVFQTIQTLVERFDRFHIQDAKLNDMMVTATMQNSLDLLGGLPTFFSKCSKSFLQAAHDRNKGYLEVSEMTEKVMSSMDVEVLFQRRILQSLHFPRMHQRRNRITRAHSQTYQWILRPKNSGSHETLVWDDFHEWLCDGTRQNIYWISGKPGSGKSTLVREIEEQIDCQENLQASIQSGDLVKVSFYFWWGGNANERSLSGALRTLAHQLLELHRELIYEVVSAPRMEIAQFPSLQMPEWEEAELIELLKWLIDLYKTRCHLLLLVDGLDELDGIDDSREQMIDFLRVVSEPHHVKLCVASRPWSVFRDAFRHDPQLRLEDLTKEDIKFYVQSTLQNNQNFRLLANSQSDLTTELTYAICTRARGVFLWVRLVLRDLLRVIRDGGGRKQVFRELEKIPTELDEYFERMITSIPSTYRKEASMLLQTTLCNMDYSVTGGKEIPGPDLLLIHLDWVDEDTDADFAVQPDFQPMPFFDGRQETQDLLRRLEQKLESRCMGLLELDKQFHNLDSSHMLPTFTRVEFLHRTVKDFLLTSDAQSKLRDYSGRDFDPHLFRCGILVAHFKSRAYVPDDMKFEVVLCCLKQLASRTDVSEASFRLLEELWRIASLAPLEGINRWLQTVDEYGLAELFSHRQKYRSCVHSLAVTLRWRQYLKSRMTKEDVLAKRDRPLLDHALCGGYTEHADNPDPSVVNELLRKGADPHAGYGDVSILARFLVRMQMIPQFDKEACLEILHNIIKFAPDICISSDELRKGRSQWTMPDSTIEAVRIDDQSGMQAHDTLGDALRRLRPYGAHLTDPRTKDLTLFSEFEIRSLERALQLSLAARERSSARRTKRKRAVSKGDDRLWLTSTFNSDLDEPQSSHVKRTSG
jgi:hypothetical protein